MIILNHNGEYSSLLRIIPFLMLTLHIWNVKWKVFYEKLGICHFLVAMETSPLSYMDHFGPHFLGITSVTSNIPPKTKSTLKSHMFLGYFQ